MSDLIGAGGASRATAGAMSAQHAPVTMRTPQQIMRDRQVREARKQANPETAQTRRDAPQQAQHDEQRRREAERGAAAAGLTGQTQFDYTRTEPPTTALPSVGGPVMSSSRRARPSAQAPSSARPGHQQQQQQQQHRTAGTSPPYTHSARVARDGQPRDPTVSTFPHAFERWEQLSSHWEGLTSYWIRRLEQNEEELAHQPPAQQMSRQITDLSAAGANLFHAVVELQRLRASSERKFQRWFYETRNEQERQQEGAGELRKQLELEHAAREEALEQLRVQQSRTENAERMAQEKQRELGIAKGEAQRAWEELGRREQEERERVTCLRHGNPALVGGMPVMSMVTEQPMGERDGMPHHAGPTSTQARQQPTNIEGGYSYGSGTQSPTCTDPFSDPSQHHHDDEPDIPSLAQGTYRPSRLDTTQGSGSSTARASHSSGLSSATRKQHTFSHGGAGAGPAPSTSAATSDHFYQHADTFLPGGRTPNSGLASPQGGNQSYVPSSAGDTNSIGGGGDDDRLVDDSNARRGPARIRDPATAVPLARASLPHSGDGSSEDDYDVGQDIAREQELALRYGIPHPPGPSDPGAYDMPANAPDYSGAGYDDWSGMRHHHPTRLSDVVEEDERSRTSASRASQASRGLRSAEP